MRVLLKSAYNTCTSNQAPACPFLLFCKIIQQQQKNLAVPMLCLYTPNVHIHGINSSKYGQTRLELVSLIFVVVSL